MHFGLGILIGLFVASGSALAGHPRAELGVVQNKTPSALEEVGIDQKLGAKVDLEIPFVNELGKPTSLKSILADGKPLLLSLAYFQCPQICSVHLQNLVGTLKSMPPGAGDQFHFVVVSFDPREKSDLAAAKRESILRTMERSDFSKSVHLLTGDEANIKRLTSEVGFRYRWDEKENQYAHASTAIVITPDGKVSRYFPGIVFDAKTMRLSLIEAGQGRVGTFIDKLTLYCFHWDAALGKYTVTAFNVLRGAATLAIVALGIFLIPFWLRQRRAA